MTTAQPGIASLVLGDDVESVNNTRNVAEKGQQDVDPKVKTDADLEKDSEGRQQDGEQDSDDVHDVLPVDGNAV